MPEFMLHSFRALEQRLREDSEEWADELITVIEAMERRLEQVPSCPLVDIPSIKMVNKADLEAALQTKEPS